MEANLYRSSAIFFIVLVLVISIFLFWKKWRSRSLRLSQHNPLNNPRKLTRIFAALIENSTDFIGIADENGKPIYVNPAGRQLVGLEPDFPIEKTQISEYYPEEIRDFATNVIFKNMIEKGTWHGETLFRNFKTNQSIPVSDKHFLIRDQNGQILGMGTITRDLSDKRARTHAEAVSTAKSEFLASISHDIRAPLTIILGYADLLKKDGVGSMSVGQVAERIASTGNQLLDLVNDILDLSIIESGKMEVNSKACNIKHELQELYIHFDLIAKKRNITWTLEFAKEFPKELVIDWKRLQQVLINIVDNAFKYTESGYVKLFAEVNTPEPGKTGILRFEVKDSGIGISPSEQVTLFEAYKRVEYPRSSLATGTGLGLGFARKLANILGGDVKLVESALNKGSTFEITVQATVD